MEREPCMGGGFCMTRTQRWITLGILLALAAMCAFFTAHVLTWQKQERLQAFQNRFADPARFFLAPGEGVEMTLEDGRLQTSWEDTQADELRVETEKAVAAQGREICVSVYAGGKQNAWAHARWNYQVWLELSLYRDGQEVAAKRAELPWKAIRGARAPAPFAPSRRMGLTPMRCACGLRLWMG